jgi:hypothetical protein
MRKQVFRLLVGVIVWLVFGRAGAEAQSFQKMTVQVPFDFNIRDQHYPAGAYAVVREGPFLCLRDGQGRRLNVLLAHSLVTRQVPTESKLVFVEYHGVHLLTQILWKGNSVGAEFVRAGREEEIARRLVPNVTSAQVGGK